MFGFFLSAAIRRRVIDGQTGDRSRNKRTMRGSTMTVCAVRSTKGALHPKFGHESTPLKVSMNLDTYAFQTGRQDHMEIRSWDSVQDGLTNSTRIDNSRIHS